MNLQETNRIIQRTRESTGNSDHLEHSIEIKEDDYRIHNPPEFNSLEKKVLILICEGKRPKEAAALIGIDYNSFSRIRTKIRKIFNVENDIQTLYAAICNEYVQLEVNE